MVRLLTLLPSLAAIASFVPNAAAHPGEHHDESEVRAEIAKRGLHADHIRRGLANCAGNAKFHAINARAMERRFAKAQELRSKRGLPLNRSFKTRRDLAALETFEADNHNYTTSDYTSTTAASTLFANYNNVSCILTPEVTEGPYYVTGEYIRSDVTDGQEGVPVHLEYQYIDVSTCEVVEGLYVDTWQANATGVYSGVQASGNGNEDDASNLNSTALRGMQPTDSEGVAAFDTIFVGHYEGRAAHIHLMAHHAGTILANNTYVGGNVTHVGQLFFQEELKDVVEATYPYNTNTQAITTNDEDMWAPDQADNSYDPIPDSAYLGDDISDGLLMWISIGIDLSEDYTYSAAAAYTADGGVVDSDSAVGGTGSGASGNGTAPTGGDSGNGTAPTGGDSGNGTAPTGSGSGNGTAPTGSSVLLASATSGELTTTADATTTTTASSTSTSTHSTTAAATGTSTSSSATASHSSSTSSSSISSHISASASASTSTHTSSLRSSTAAAASASSSSSSHHSSAPAASTASSASHSSSSPKSNTASGHHSNSISINHPHNASNTHQVPRPTAYSQSAHLESVHQPSRFSTETKSAASKAHEGARMH